MSYRFLFIWRGHCSHELNMKHTSWSQSSDFNRKVHSYFDSSSVSCIHTDVCGIFAFGRVLHRQRYVSVSKRYSFSARSLEFVCGRWVNVAVLKGKFPHWNNICALHSAGGGVCAFRGWAMLEMGAWVAQWVAGRVQGWVVAIATHVGQHVPRLSQFR